MIKIFVNQLIHLGLGGLPGAVRFCPAEAWSSESGSVGASRASGASSSSSVSNGRLSPFKN